MTQGRFIVGSQAQIETHAWLHQNSYISIPYNGKPKTPSYEVRLKKRVLPWRKKACIALEDGSLGLGDSALKHSTGINDRHPHSENQERDESVFLMG